MNRREFSRLAISTGMYDTIGKFTGSNLDAGRVPGGAAKAEASVRIRDLGVSPGVFPTGPLNAITDVAGVRVGHATLNEGASVRTGVTAILPHGGNLFQESVPASIYVGNAFGKLAGSTQVNELGTIETPILLTNTLSVGIVVETSVRYTLGLPGNEDVHSVNAVVGETNDATLNDIRGMHVKAEHVLAAISSASEGVVQEGCVGAGTGTICFGWKGGIGTASRKLPVKNGGYTLGVLIQTNFGGVLTIAGVQVGRELGGAAFSSLQEGARSATRMATGDGSCMIVVATDAPLDARNLHRLAKRAVIGLGRTGSSYSNGSGDYAIAFSTFAENRVPHGAAGVLPTKVLSNESVSPLFEAVLETVEEAVYNSLTSAKTTTGNGHTIEALPLDAVRSLLAKRG